MMETIRLKRRAERRELTLKAGIRDEVMRMMMAFRMK